MKQVSVNDSIFREIERQRDRETERERETERQRDRETDQRDRERDGQSRVAQLIVNDSIFRNNKYYS
jgi:hypothetical protein